MRILFFTVLVTLVGCTGMSTEPAPPPPDAAAPSLGWSCVTSWTDATGAHTHSDAYFAPNTVQGEADFEAWKQSAVAACQTSCSCACTIACQPIQ